MEIVRAIRSLSRYHPLTKPISDLVQCVMNGTERICGGSRTGIKEHYSLIRIRQCLAELFIEQLRNESNLCPDYFDGCVVDSVVSAKLRVIDAQEIFIEIEPWIAPFFQSYWFNCT